MTSPLEDQIAEVDREIRHRERLYPKWVEEGRYKQETADKKLEDIRGARASLAIIEKHRVGLRLLIETLQKYNPLEAPLSDDVIEKLVDHPAVRAVMDAFPGSIIDGVRQIPAIEPPPEHDDLFAEPADAASNAVCSSVGSAAGSLVGSS